MQPFKSPTNRLVDQEYNTAMRSLVNLHDGDREYLRVINVNLGTFVHLNAFGDHAVHCPAFIFRFKKVQTFAIFIER